MRIQALLRGAILAGILALGPGCFVIDELDSGLADMKGTSSKGAKAEEEPTETAKGEAPKRDLSAWWKSARTPSSGPKDPENAIEVVSCRIGGSIRFMSKTDCQVQGGRF